MQNLQSRIAHYNNLIPPVFVGKVPAGFSLTPTGWALKEDVVNRPNVKARFRDATTEIRPLSTMDVEFLDNTIVAAAKSGAISLVKNYPCGLKCPGCFSEDKVFGDRDRLMTWQEMFQVIDQARAIGLTSIKFLGPGEFFTNKDAFDILDACEERGLDFSVFTKGTELSVDELATTHYGHLGVTSAKALVEKLSHYKTLRILLGFNSFDPVRQDRMVGSFNRATNYSIENNVFTNRGVSDYTTKRDIALRNLTEAGFNDPAHGQRLSLIATPIQLDQIDEVPDMYVWAAMRNIPLIIAPTMESGPKSIGLMKHNAKIDDGHQRLIDLYVAVYERALKEGLMTKDQIREQGISAYPGTAPCNQVANGLFVRLNGQVQLCPGNSSDEAVFGNTHDKSIATIWSTSPNYKMGAKMNNWCAAKTNGMPSGVQEAIYKALDLD